MLYNIMFTFRWAYFKSGRIIKQKGIASQKLCKFNSKVCIEPKGLINKHSTTISSLCHYLNFYFLTFYPFRIIQSAVKQCGKQVMKITMAKLANFTKCHRTTNSAFIYPKSCQRLTLSVTWLSPDVSIWRLRYFVTWILQVRPENVIYLLFHLLEWRKMGILLLRILPHFQGWQWW